jgi:hypothetical protein
MNKEAVMATAKNININEYCDAVNSELASMKMKINELRDDVRKTYGPENDVARTHERHLVELADIIEWKLQILMKACPFEWTGADKDLDRTVSVGPAGKADADAPDFSGGYLGG